VEAHYQEKVPHLRFAFRNAEDASWQGVQLTCNNRSAVLIAQLLRLYARFSPHTVTLNALFRAWAKVRVVRVVWLSLGKG
jgi:hypothetical protein